MSSKRQQTGGSPAFLYKLSVCFSIVLREFLKNWAISGWEKPRIRRRPVAYSMGVMPNWWIAVAMAEISSEGTSLFRSSRRNKVGKRVRWIESVEGINSG